LFRGDPFLESVYWDRRASVRAFDGRYPEAVKDLEQGVRDGYPSANLWFDLGCMMELAGDAPGARRAYLRAMAIPNSRTVAAERLKALNDRMGWK
jgi:Flp pilus assembly protein TadD